MGVRDPSEATFRTLEVAAAAVIRILAIPSMLAPAACVTDPVDGSPPSIITRDSAGIQIVENGRPADASRLPWRIGAEPAASIGVLEGEEPYMLHYVADATKLPDGRIVVANMGTQELRVFDAFGIHLATWGGEGEGPGEFRSLTEVERWPGDSIVAWSASRLGMSVFDADGNYGRTFWLEDVGAWFWPESAAANGTVMAVHAPEGEDTTVVQLRDGEGRVRSSFGTHPGREPHRKNVDGRRWLFWKILGREPVWTPWGDRVAIGHTGRYEIKAFRADGTLERIVRRDHVPQAPAQADIEADIEKGMPIHGLPEAEANAVRTDWRPRYEGVPVADHLPAFRSIMTDMVAHLWVEEYESPANDFPTRLWTVFDPEGWVLGFFETPKDWRIYEIGEDYILVLVQDELEVETVQVWPLERPVNRAVRKSQTHVVSHEYRPSLVSALFPALRVGQDRLPEEVR